MFVATNESSAFSLCEKGASHRRTIHSVSVQDLAFTYWQCSANEKAYSANLITKAMYEYARDELHKSLESLSVARYNVE
jgi:hypothetical protein